MFKKGQSMSINVIIVAVIALVIMVVLISIFAGKLGIFTEETDEITSNKCREASSGAGRVIPFSSDCGDQYTVSIGPYDDVATGYKCCVPRSYE